MTETIPTFTGPELEMLKRGPLFILQCVGGADSDIDDAEWAALIEAVAARAQAGERVVRDVMTALAAEMHNHVKPAPDVHTPLEGLRVVSEILDRIAPEEAVSFKATLLDIGATIAEASGGELVSAFNAREGHMSWTAGNRMSPTELSALGEAATVLGMAVSL